MTWEYVLLVYPQDQFVRFNAKMTDLFNKGFLPMGQTPLLVVDGYIYREMVKQSKVTNETNTGNAGK